MSPQLEDFIANQTFCQSNVMKFIEANFNFVRGPLDTALYYENISVPF